MKKDDEYHGDYYADIEIEKDALDEEWIKQPMLFFRYSEKCSEARREMDLAKEELDLVRADLDRRIREAPGDFGLAKATETAISNAILLHEDYKAASRKLIKARHTWDLLSKAVQAFDQKKAALENLVRLLSLGYFADPQQPEGSEWNRHVSNSRVRRKARRES